ncbi:RDD family protein [Sulfurimonas sp.]|uniref:RDD family protein n=1 Tax=Sulfurimonas sp. TaxID=2022749 RepID=UPI002AAF54CE|nr:RDD family protein [Sulfurimonas sp.]
MRFRNIKNKNKQNTDQIKPKYTHARVVNRIKAFITDMFMIYMPIMFVVTYVIVSGKDALQASEFAPFLGTLTYGIVYSIFLTKLGQTPGKKAYDLKVVNAKTGEYISFFRAMLRFVAFLFTATTVLGLLVSFYRKDRRSLHDLISGTLVVVEKK